jgi:hypothetical protein
MPAGVAVGEGVREETELHGALRRHVRRLAAVRPRRRAPDRHHHVEPALLGVADERVEVVEVVGGVVPARRVLRLRRSDRRPTHCRAHDRRVRLRGLVELGRRVRRPAERRIVLEADGHAQRCGGERRRCEREEREDESDAGGPWHGRCTSLIWRTKATVASRCEVGVKDRHRRPACGVIAS